MLDQLTSASAVPAIEWVLCGKEEGIAHAGIGRLKQIEAYEATRALARQAVFNRWPGVRQSAAEALKDRKLEDFVPDLVSLLATESTLSVMGTGHRPYSPFVMNFVLLRETEDQFQMQILEAFEPLHVRIVTYPRRGGLRRVSTLSRDTDREQADFSRRVLEETYLQEKRLEEQNNRTRDLNGRVAAVLAAVSGRSELETPRDWWDWWDGYNQYETPEKPVRVEKRRATDVTFSHELNMSCLAAGTLLWTRAGTRAVERLQTGDLLLTQDVESGELGYAPVLRTTERSPTTVFRLQVKGESFVATGGHRFWVPGEGWRRVNDLKAGSLLHTATGSVAVTAIEPVPDEAVYNVVISPTHNYFVGEQALLTHDVTLPRSTNRKVPGLVEP